MDLTNDGVKDVLTGCYPGQVFLFVGKQDGTFEKGVKLQNKFGKEINVGRAAAVHAVDWDRDGDLDLLIGNIQGEVYWVPSEGAEGALLFGEPVAIEAGGKKIAVDGRNAGPCVADWDRDGQPDLLVGCGNGGVMFYRNTTERGIPQLERGVAIVGPSPTWRSRTPAKVQPDGPQRGARAKVCVADWNNDGRPDLLLGDYGSRPEPEPVLTEEQKVERDRLRAEQKKIRDDYMAVRARLDEQIKEKYGYKPREAPAEKRDELNKAWLAMLRADPGYQAYATKSREIYQKLRPLQAGRTSHGHVWVFLRKKSRWL